MRNWPTSTCIYMRTQIVYFAELLKVSKLFNTFSRAFYETKLLSRNSYWSFLRMLLYVYPRVYLGGDDNAIASKEGV